MIIRNPRVQDYIFQKFDNELITANIPIIYVNSIITTSRYVDLGDKLILINHRTGEKAEIRFKTKGWLTDCSLEGSIYDSSGAEKYTLAGSWKS